MTLYALIILQFTFIGNPRDQVVSMEAWKAPYILPSEQACREQIEVLKKLAPKEKNVYDCEPIEDL